VLCITFQGLFCQVNSTAANLVSDSAKVHSNSLQILDKAYQRLKIPVLKKDDEKRLWLLPAIAWNNYDKTQLGLIIGLEKKDNYSLMAIPMYATGSGNLTGLLKGNYTFKTPRINRWDIGLKAKRFSYLLFPEDLTYNVIEPSLRIIPNFKAKGDLSLTIRSRYIWQEYLLGGRQTQAFNIHHIALAYSTQKSILVYRSNFEIDVNKSFGLAKWTNDLRISYTKHKNNAAYIRGFMGSFLFNNSPSSNIDPPLPIFQLGGLSNSGVYWLQKDYEFEDFYLDRNAQDNFLQRQVADSEGGFKSVMSIGNTNQFLASINVRSDILIPSRIKRWFNIQPFANGAISKNKGMKADWYAEGGASLLFFNEVIGFHVPFVSTTNIKLNQQTAYGIANNDWTKRISFSIDLISIKRMLESEIN
jgi:hypothetical protein